MFLKRDHLTDYTVQATYGASQILQERIFYSALLGSNATVTVTVGGAAVTAGWETDILPADGVGIYHGSASFTGKTGQVVVSTAFWQQEPTLQLLTF